MTERQTTVRGRGRRTREGVDTNNPALVVDREVTRNETFEELFVRLGLRGLACGARGALALVLGCLEEIVG